MLRQIKKAIELDPLSGAATHAAAQQFFLARQFNEALKLEERALELAPFHRGARFLLPLILQELGRTDEAIAKASGWRKDEPFRPEPTGALAWVLARSGRLDQVRPLLDELEGLRRQSKANTGDIWYLYVPLGDLDKAFDCLNQAIDSRDADVSVIRLAPGLESMRADPRYRALLRRVNLESEEP